MKRFIIHHNELTKKGTIVTFDEVNYKDITRLIKNKFRIKPKKIFLSNGTLLDQYNSLDIKDGDDIIFTTGKDYVPKDKHINNDAHIEIFAKKSYISTDAVKMLERTAKKLEDIAFAYGMPDLHVGGFCPIGASLWTKDIVHPSLIGTDIGCGMTLFKTDINIKSINISKLGKKINSIDGPIINMDLDILTDKKGILCKDYNNKLGTIGNGNHFCEIQVINEIYDETLFNKYNFGKNCYYILVHSGSRGYGYDILNMYQNQILQGEKIDDYLKDHNDAMRWAVLNRELIGKRMANEIKINCSTDKLIDIYHNFVERDSSDQYWIHRKGCASSDKGIVIIPGSRGDFSYIVKPTANNKSMSLAHGAGRKIARGSTLKRKKINDRQFIQNKFDSLLICDNNDLIYEEAPKAYKSIECVVDDLVSFGFIELIAKLEPVLTYKTKKK